MSVERKGRIANKAIVRGEEDEQRMLMGTDQQKAPGISWRFTGAKMVLAGREKKNSC